MAGWLGDPTGRHRLRYRDRHWTEWVADKNETQRDPDGLAQIQRSRRRNLILGIVILVAGVPLALFLGYWILVGLILLIFWSFTPEAQAGIERFAIGLGVVSVIVSAAVLLRALQRRRQPH